MASPLSKDELAMVVGGIAAFEAIAWVGPSPYFSHDGPLTPRIIMGAINSLPHAAFAWHLMSNARPSTTALSLYVPYSLAFATGQCRFWWVPYLTGVSNGSDVAMLSKKSGYIRAMKVLPALPWSARIPSLEHTLLIAPSVIAAATSCNMMKSAIGGSFSSLSTTGKACLAGLTAIGLAPAVVPIIKDADHAPASAIAGLLFVAGLGYTLGAAVQSAIA